MSRQRKSEIIIIRTAPQFKAKLFELAEKQDKPVSQVVRESVLKANEKELSK